MIIKFIVDDLVMISGSFIRSKSYEFNHEIKEFDLIELLIEEFHQL